MNKVIITKKDLQKIDIFELVNDVFNVCVTTGILGFLLYVLIGFTVYLVLYLSPMLICILVFLIHYLIKVINTISYIKAIKNNTYTIEENILVNKKFKFKLKNTKFYFYFQNENKKILTTNDDYSRSEIWDKFYIIKAGRITKAYNTKLYELEDKSKFIGGV